MFSAAAHKLSHISEIAGHTHLSHDLTTSPSFVKCRSAAPPFFPFLAFPSHMVAMLHDDPAAEFDAFDPSWFEEPGTVPSPAGSADQLSPEEQRRLRRKISNRESARRCRKRKQLLREDLQLESDQLATLNRHMAKELGALTHRCLLVRRANQRLRAERAALSKNLADLQQALMMVSYARRLSWH